MKDSERIQVSIIYKNDEICLIYINQLYLAEATFGVLAKYSSYDTNDNSYYKIDHLLI